MKKSMIVTAVTLLVAVVFVTFTSNAKEPSNPLVGTWKSLSVVDSAGNEIEFYKGEAGYETLLEDGTFFFLGFRNNFPQTGIKPTTLEEYKEIGKNAWSRIGTYKVDMENHRVSLKYTHDLRPQRIGHEMTANFKVVGDTAIYWFDRGKNFAKYLKVK